MKCSQQKQTDNLLLLLLLCILLGVHYIACTRQNLARIGALQLRQVSMTIENV